MVRPAPLRPQHGFTLIEVLVALVILAVAVTSIVAGVSKHAANAAYLHERTFAHWVAMNKITEMQVSGEWPGAGERQGDALMAGAQWKWEIKISTTDDPDVRRLDISVYANREQSALATMVAYLGRPQ